MMKEEKSLKRYLKRKVSFTQAIFVAFLITGALSYAEPIVLNTVDIHITKIEEEGKGLELGTNSRARGNGSIATGTNAIAIGNNAVATGGNETKEKIDKKLAENKTKLDEIKLKEKEVLSLGKELEDLKIRERETIEAGIRVAKLAKQKENAKKEWERLRGEHKDLVDGSVEFFKEHQVKIDELNSRLAGLSKISGVDISSEEGLNKAATDLKSIVEKDNTLNLTIDFYKTYVSSYYTALGELTKNKAISSSFREGEYTSAHPTNRNGNSSQVKNSMFGMQSSGEIKTGITFAGEKVIWSHNSFLPLKKGMTITNVPTKEVKIYELDTVTKTFEEYQEAIKELELYRGAAKEYLEGSNDIFLTTEVKNSFNKNWDAKIDYNKKIYEVAYYQHEYATTGNKSWLDKKKVALDEAKKIGLSIKKEDNLGGLRNKAYQKWAKENITDVEEENKITTEMLTSELEKALGIKRDEILKKEKEIADKKASVDNAKNTYDSLNPSKKDLILSKEYERVAKVIKEKGEILKTAAERLQWLRDNLSIHDLTNVGADAIAIGTDSLASGNAAIAIGKANISTKENAIAIGSTNLVSGENSIAIGLGNNIIPKTATDKNMIAIGEQNSVSGDKSLAIGFGHKVVGQASSTMGDPNAIYGDNNHVYGNNNKVGTEAAPKNNVFILGSNVDASTVGDAVVLGNNSTAVSGAVSVGSLGAERKIVNLAKGTIGATSTDAINGGQLHAFANASSTDINVDAWKVKLGGIPNIEVYSGGNKTVTYSQGTKLSPIDNTKLKFDFGDGLLSSIEDNASGEKVVFIRLDKEALKKDPAFKGDAGVDGANGKDGIADLTGEITPTEEKGVKGKVIDKHLKDNYVNKKDLQGRDEAIVNNHKEIQSNKQAIENNSKRIEQVNQKVNKTAALAQATANLDFGQVKVGNVAVGAGIGGYSSETGVAVGVAYRPNEEFFITAKMSVLTGDSNYTSYGASASYQFSVK